MVKYNKRNSWRYPTSTIKAKKKEIIENALDPQPMWDDWGDPRDGQRDFGKDRTKRLHKKSLRKDDYYKEKDVKHYKKVKKHEFIRKLRRKNEKNKIVL